MILYIVRHGIAINRDDPECPEESERYLTEEGVQRTLEAMQGLKAIAEEPEVMLSSHFVRAMQTAEIAAEVFGCDADSIEQSDALVCGCDANDFLEELEQRSEEVVMCFGHAPHLDELIGCALGLEQEVTELKKAGAACLELHSLAPPGGILRWLMTP